MDFTNMLSELRAERTRIEDAILAIQRIVSGQGKRRGRPPKWMSTIAGAFENVADGPVSGKRRRRKPFSAATRRKMAESQKKRWAAIRKAA